ncbi:MAG: DsbA family protein [Chloroflexi bacterium]|nr:DsbA family protein [Chloroflexota bacterium]
MVKKQQQGAPTKRQMIRDQRAKQQRNQRLAVILIVAFAAVLVTGLLIYPSLKAAATPVGEIVAVTPGIWPQADGAKLGDPNAPVLIEVWEDFQCPACKTYTEEAERLVIDNYVAAGKVYYVFRHYPFIDDRSASSESDQAANASMCAAEQGAFWDYHTMLFANWNSENAGAYIDKRLVAFADSIGLDMGQFNACFKENRFEDQINKDFADGQKAGVTGTPSVFVNGVLLTPGYVPSYQEISAAVEAALAGG